MTVRHALLAALGVFIVIVLAAAVVLLRDDSPSLEAVGPAHAGVNTDPTGGRWVEMTVCLTNPGSAQVTDARFDGDEPRATGLRDESGGLHGAVRVSQECIDAPSYRAAQYLGSRGGQRLLIDVDGQAPADAEATTVVLTYTTTDSPHEQQLEVTIPPVR